MNMQLEQWSSDFGRAYTDRNAIDWHARVPAFRTMLSGLSLARVLEVGCNRGPNLQALSHLLGPETELVGIEPNTHAVEMARQAAAPAKVLRGEILDLPFPSGYFDLTLTVGVLIHIPLDSLHSAITELARSSRRYLLAAEYFAPQETEISYRGQSNLLWKRDFLKHFQECLPGAGLLRSGFWGAEDGFDRVHWWLLEQQGN